MKKRFLVITMLAMFLLTFNIQSVFAATVYSDEYIAPDTTIGSTAIDGDFIVAGASWLPGLTLEGSFSGWGDLGSYSDLTATLTFTWHDENLNYSMGGNIFTEGTRDTNELYKDLAVVSLDGITVLENVEVGVVGSTEASVYEYTITDLSILSDGELTYLIEAGVDGSARTDFIVDSVALKIETPSAVPVPGAVWLLGSGLLGLAGLRRRNTAR